MPVQPYLFFDGKCEEAIEFYKKTLGAQLDALMRFKDSPEPCSPDMPAQNMDKVMHSAFTVGGTTIMASDGHCGGKPSFQGFGLSYPVKTEAEADRAFAALSEDGQVQVPLTKTFFSPRFGIAVDRFGVTWMVLVEQ